MRRAVLPAGFLVLIIAFVLNAWIYRAASRQYESTERLVAHTHEVLAAVSNVVTTVSSAETGQRGYIITGDSAFLERYDSAKQHISEQLTALQTLVADEPDQLKRLDVLSRIKQEKFADLDQGVQLRRAGDEQAARTLVATNSGKRLLDGFRTLAAEMRASEERRLAQQTKDTETSRIRADRSILVGTSIGCALILLMFVIVQRGFASARQQEKSNLALRTSEAKLQGIISSAMDAIISVDQDERVVVFNRAAEKIFGCPATEAIGGPLNRFIPKRFHKVHHEHVRRFGSAGATSRSMYSPGVLMAVRADGKEFPIEATISQVEAAGQKLYTVILRDITERKRTEEALKRSEQNLRVALSAAQMGVAFRDASTGAYIWDERVRAMFGLSPDESIDSSTLERITHPEDRWLHADAIRRATVNEGEYSVEFRVVWPDKSIHWIYARGTTLTDSNGELSSVVGVCIDITDRKKAEEALRLSEERFRSMFDHAAVGIMQVANDGQILMANSAVSQMLGYTAEEMQSKTFEDLTHPKDRQQEWELLLSMLRGERESYEMEKRYLHRDGHAIWVNVSSSLVKDAAGFPLHRITVIQNIGERKRVESLEEQLRQSQKMEAIGRLAGGVAHDFNTLLNVMLGYAELLKDELAPEDPRRDRAEQIEKSAMTASMLTKQLLAFSRKQAVVPQVVDLCSLVSGMEPMLRRLVREDIDFTVKCSKEQSHVKVDPGQIQQVVMNLVANARDAMPDGGRLFLEVRNVQLGMEYVLQHPGMKPGPYSMIAVSDTGQGMDSATVARIFEPFFTTKKSGQGTGLGLATVYGIVKQNAGDIWVYSEPGVGTIFKTYLPLSNEQQPTIARPVSSERRQLAGGETVLVVEDSTPLRQLTREILSREGYIVLEACDGEQAIEVSRSYEKTIHLMVTDIIMPKVRGIEAAARVREQRPDIAVVFLSGYTEEAINQIHSTNHVNVLEKPYTSETLLRTVRKALDDAQSDSMRKTS